MTTPVDPPGVTGYAVEQADMGDVDVLAQVIAYAFFDLAVSQWLVPEPNERRAIFPGYFRAFVKRALEEGIVLTTPVRTAAALWIPVGPDGPDAVPEQHHEELAVLTGSNPGRFQVLDESFVRRHPVGVPHEHLAILAVRPDKQGQGIGTALLRARHAVLDREETPAYLEASDAGTRAIYLKHGYVDLGEPIQLPDGPPMYPMWRPADPAAGAAVWCM